MVLMMVTQNMLRTFKVTKAFLLNKIVRFVNAVDKKSNALHSSTYWFYSTRAHLFLGHHVM